MSSNTNISKVKAEIETHLEYIDYAYTYYLSADWEDNHEKWVATHKRLDHLRSVLDSYDGETIPEEPVSGEGWAFTPAE